MCWWSRSLESCAKVILKQHFFVFNPTTPKAENSQRERERASEWEREGGREAGRERERCDCSSSFGNVCHPTTEGHAIYIIGPARQSWVVAFHPLTEDCIAFFESIFSFYLCQLWTVQHSLEQPPHLLAKIVRIVYPRRVLQRNTKKCKLDRDQVYSGRHVELKKVVSWCLGRVWNRKCKQNVKGKAKVRGEREWEWRLSRNEKKLRTPPHLGIRAILSVRARYTNGDATVTDPSSTVGKFSGVMMKPMVEGGGRMDKLLSKLADDVACSSSSYGRVSAAFAEGFMFDSQLGN